MSVNKIIAIFGIILVIFVTVILFQFTSNSKSSKVPPFKTTSSVTIDKHTFNVAVAKTDAQQQQGLSGQPSMKDDQGMLFLFNKPDYYAFWMKDMKFSLDIIYIANNKIVYILHKAPSPAPGVNTPPIFQPTAPSDKVLEINAGLSDKYGFKEGDAVTIK